jgi:hypothetical protein
MRPSLFLYLSPLALGAGALYLLARPGPAGPDHEPLTDPWPLMAPDLCAMEEVRRAGQRHEAKRQVACALIDGRLTLPQAVAQFRDIDAEVSDKARHWRLPLYTEEE